GLRFCPHGHVSAIAVAANANFVSIDGKLLDHGVDASHEVAIITAPEILDVALGESFALTIAAAGIGTKYEPAKKRSGTHVAHRGGIPLRIAGPTRPAVNAENERIFLRRIVILGERKPSFNV